MNTNRARATIIITSLLFSLALGACPKSAGPGPDPKRPAAADGTYTVKFHRPLKVGDQYHYTTHATEIKRMEVNGKPLPNEMGRTKVVFESIVTVKAVSAAGKATSEEHKVISSSSFRKLMNMPKAMETVPLAKDTVVLAQVADGKEMFTIDGKPVAAPVASFLNDVVDLSTKNSAINDDDIMGSAEPRKPGDTWNLNAEKMITRMKPEFKGAVVMPKVSDITGTVQFVRLRQEKGIDGMDLVMKTSINNFAPDMNPVKATSGSMKIEMKGWMPTDTQSFLGFHTANMSMRVAGTMTKNGQTANIVFDFSSVRYRRRAAVTP